MFKGRLVGMVYDFFLCFVCTVLFYVCFGKFAMTFIDGEEIGCMSIPKYHRLVTVVNLVKQTRFFLHDAACGCGFVYAGSVWDIPGSSCDNGH